MRFVCKQFLYINLSIGSQGFHFLKKLLTDTEIYCIKHISIYLFYKKCKKSIIWKIYNMEKLYVLENLHFSLNQNIYTVTM